LRLVVLTIALVFGIALGVFTVLDFARNGVTGLGVLSALIVVLFLVAIAGAMSHPPSE